MIMNCLQSSSNMLSVSLISALNMRLAASYNFEAATRLGCSDTEWDLAIKRGKERCSMPATQSSWKNCRKDRRGWSHWIDSVRSVQDQFEMANLSDFLDAMSFEYDSMTCESATSNHNVGDARCCPCFKEIANDSIGERCYVWVTF
jgi:hypothetical protein